MMFWLEIILDCVLIYYLGKFALFLIVAFGEKEAGCFDERRNELKW